MIFRKLGFGAVIISLALLLTSCVEVRGDLSVSSAGRINGEIIYTLNKSLAAGVGLNSLADVKNEASTNPEVQIGFCKDAPITEDASNYILKCALKDVISESGDISASVTGGNIVFRYKANLDATSDQSNFGSVSITIRFLDSVISFKENKAGLVTRVDDRTYRISGAANEPMNIEITANLTASSGSTITTPAPAPSTTTNPTGESSTAVDAANKAAADLKAKEEADAKAIADKAAADLKAKEEAEAKAAADKAAEDLKTKQEAEAKAASELKAKQEADAKAAADLKTKEEADAKALAEKTAADLKAKQEAEAADLKTKQEAEAKAIADKAAADLKSKQETEAKIAAEKAAAELKAKKAAEAKATATAAKILAAAKAKAKAKAKAAAAAAAKKTTITCVKGKLTKKVTAVKPVCPKGYKTK